MVVKLPETREKIIENLLRVANTKLPEDIGWALEAAAGWEANPVAATQLAAIMENVRKAEHLGKPMCQDTGIPIFYVRGKIDGTIARDIAEAVANSTSAIPMRPNTVDPIKLKMLNPSDGMDGVKRFIIDSVIEAGGRPCPPGIVGVGIGGTADECTAMAKRALLEPLDMEDPDPEIQALEEELFVKINQSGLGPMGLGGSTTVLGVKVRKSACHTASLPVAVNIGCWATRRACARITDTDVVYSQGVRL